MAPDFSSYIKTASFSFNSLHFLTNPKYCCIVFFSIINSSKGGTLNGSTFYFVCCVNLNKN